MTFLRVKPGLDWCHSAWLGLFSWQKASWMLLLAFSCIIVCYVSRVRHSDLIYIEMVQKWYGASHFYCYLDIILQKKPSKFVKKNPREALVEVFKHYCIFRCPKLALLLLLKFFSLWKSVTSLLLQLVVFVHCWKEF